MNGSYLGMSIPGLIGNPGIPGFENNQSRDIPGSRDWANLSQFSIKRMPFKAKLNGLQGPGLRFPIKRLVFPQFWNEK